jgi:hypothetical protein
MGESHDFEKCDVEKEKTLEVPWLDFELPRRVLGD